MLTPQWRYTKKELEELRNHWLEQALKMKTELVQNDCIERAKRYEHILYLKHYKAG